MEEMPQNRKAPVTQDSASLLRLLGDGERSLGHLRTLIQTMSEPPVVESVAVANFWIFHDGIDAMSKFLDSATRAIRAAKLQGGAYNAAGSPIPERATAKGGQENEDASTAKPKAKARGKK